jgi:cellobiose phosphorylase
VEGGWRVYSSGAGIAVHLVRECLLGVRLGRSRLTLDPVLPRWLDGLVAVLDLEESEVEIAYRIRQRGYGPTALALNDRPLRFEREPNPYRTGAAVVSMADVRERLVAGVNRLVVELE